MQISKYEPTLATVKELNELVRRKYKGSQNLDFFLEDFQKALDFCTSSDNVSFYPFAGRSNGSLESHGALILDKRLPAKEAFFGFMEFPHDPVTFSSLWNSLLQEARQHEISLLKGPVNGSIWHQYRCIKEAGRQNYFKAEPFSKAYYYDFFASKNPSAEISYYSASREPLTIVLRVVDRSALDTMARLGFSIRVAKEISLVELRRIAEISRLVFSGSWGYTKLSENEFLRLYSHEKLDEHLNALYLLYKDDEIVGFCSTSKENATTLICKTIAVLPQYQGMGLGNALAYTIHSDAAEAGFTKMIYALIRDGNNIQNFPKDGAVIFRRYAAFEFKI